MSALEVPTGSQFGAQLRAWRKAAGLSQNEVGTLAGCNHSLVGNYERGRFHPGRDTALRLADALKVDREEMWICVLASRDVWAKRQSGGRIPITTYVPPQVAEWIDGIVESRGLSRSQILGRMLLQAYRAAHPVGMKKAVDPNVAPDAPALNMATPPHPEVPHHPV